MSNPANDELKNAKENLAAARAKANALRPWYRKKRFLIPIGLVVLIIISNLLSPNSEEPPTSPSGDTLIQEPAEVAPDPENFETISEENARKKGESYLRSSCFSRTRLIGQLEYEGFSSADAKYAVDAINPDWKQQAACKADSYLKSSAFSRQRLIDQLLYEGFTKNQAEFGVSSVGY